MKVQIQQGDVLFERVTTMPAGGRVVPRSSRGFVLAEGEATGHAHVIDVADGELELREIDGVLYARIAQPVEVRHEEHKPVSLDPGTYRVGRVREFDHFMEEARTVAD